MDNNNYCEKKIDKFKKLNHEISLIWKKFFLDFSWNLIFPLIFPDQLWSSLIFPDPVSTLDIGGLCFLSKPSELTYSRNNMEILVSVRINRRGDNACLGKCSGDGMHTRSCHDQGNKSDIFFFHIMILLGKINKGIVF